MCARWRTIAMSKLFFWVWTKLLPLHGCDVMRFGVMCLWFDLLSSDVASCEVICGATPVLLCTTKNYNVLLQYYSTVLLCTTMYYSSTTTKYYSSTTLYYKVLRQYYSVLHSTIPVLLSTTKYYASTTLYYKVLHQYYSSTTPVLQRTTPVLLWNVIYNARRNKSHRPTSPNTAPATQNECHQWSASHMKPHFQCVEQVKSPSNLTKYCACHAKWIASFIRIAYETSFPLRGASKVTLQTQQILRLPRKMNVINDLRHIWNLISNAWGKSSHPPTSPNIAPATQNQCHQWSASHMKRHFQCVEQVKSPSNLTKYCACHAKCKSSMICVAYETSFPMRGASKVTLQPHQIPSSMICVTYETSFPMPEQVKSPSNLTKYCACHAKWTSSMIMRDIWNVISNAWSK